mmetsp:Transcript_35265/g.76092  ORF Transcript_35265/g.76092 Transcript_35265/m.76092 type:complete len:80 (-) Transcript_35265:562-801(-)
MEQCCTHPASNETATGAKQTQRPKGKECTMWDHIVAFVSAPWRHLPGQCRLTALTRWRKQSGVQQTQHLLLSRWWFWSG